MKGLPARTGLEWLKQGFALFRRQPGILTLVLVTNFLFAMLLANVPVLGKILPLLLIPSFTMALQQACRQIDEGQRVMPSVLLTGFRKETVGRLCKLGMVYVAVVVLLILVVSPWIDVESVRNAAKMIEANKQPTINASTTFAVIAFMLLLSLSMLALSFAPGVTYWKKMPVFKALFYSVFAVLGSLRALVVMLLSLFGIYWAVSMVIGQLFGHSQMVLVVLAWLNLIFALVYQCAIYAAYKQVLGAPDSD